MPNSYYWLPLLLGFGLYGCISSEAHTDGMRLIKEGRTVEGLAALSKAIREEPANPEYRSDYLSQREKYLEEQFSVAQKLRSGGNHDGAEKLYKQILLVDSANVRARMELDEIARQQRQRAMIDSSRAAFQAGEMDRASSLLRPLLMEAPDFQGARDLMREIEASRGVVQVAEPILQSTFKPINLEFRDTNIRMAFEIFARTTGISFIFDKDVRPDLRTTVFLRNALVEDAIDLILQTCQLQKKVLNANTVLIYPNTPEKLKEYKELVTRAFYLQNTDVKQVQNTLKTLLKAKDIVVDEKLNLLIMRDTPEAIRLAEKLVAMHDIPEPEVMLELEVLEVQRDRLTDLGVQWPGQLTLSPLATASGNLTLHDLQHLGPKNVGASLSKAIVNIQRDITETNILANPRIRVKNRETAKIMIGDKVPVVTTTTTATGLVSDSVQYLDVGLKVDIQPDIYLRDEVAIKVGLEVSSIVKEVTSLNGTLSYQVGSRSASTVLRLKDGETQILAGLINDQERTTGSGVPGLGDLPIIGRLFSSRQDTHNKTEIVLSITPHLVRNIERPDVSAAEFWSGTEATLKTKPLTLQTSSQPRVDVRVPSGGQDAKASTLEPISNATIAPAQTITISWVGSQQVKRGETFKLALKVDSDGNVRSLPFQASFDPSIFQVVQIEEGDFFKQDGGATSFSSNVDANNGKFFVSVIRSDLGKVSGAGVVAAVTLRALAVTGKSAIQVLAASPLVVSGKTPGVRMPAPHEIVVSE